MESPGPSAFIGHLLPFDPQLTSPACVFYFFYFYRPQTKFEKVMFLHLSVSHSVHGGCLGLCPGGGSLSRGISVQGVSVQGVSVRRSLSRGVSVQGGLCLRGLCPGEVSVQGDLCPGCLSPGEGSVCGDLCPGGLCPGGLCLGGSLSGGLCLGE